MKDKFNLFIMVAAIVLYGAIMVVFVILTRGA